MTEFAKTCQVSTGDLQARFDPVSGVFPFEVVS